MSRRHPNARRATTISAAALTLGSAMLLTACAGGGGGGQSPSAEAVSLTFVAGVKGDPFYITMACGAEQAALAAGVDFDFQAPNTFSPTDQVPIVDAVAAAAPDALLIAPTDAASMFAPIQRVIGAGTKVVLVDTTLEDDEGTSASVKTDDYAGGVEAARELAELTGGSGEVLLINFLPGVSTTDARGKGFVDEAAKLGLTVVAEEFAGTDVEKASQIVDASLQRHPDLAGIFTTTDYGAQGTVTSLRNADALRDVKVVGFDASPVMVEELRAGNIQTIVSQQARTIGELGVEEALKALRGEASSGTLEVPTITITEEDLESPDAQAGLQVESCG
ncbi:ABC transporter substrate-binding protein [Microbacterium aurantiacum]|uniref:Periplasmic binding protein domain-containing protein n=1 Tax=Microbacterium aurantiacum TaxID=162393 RepID=A0A0M8MKN5_9MICO|nr:ABC transporter substrate-binding protein [Microbacterium chocolatum]ANG84831.1 hypothetical protein A8L33_05025 [Microbacterium chocolatum]KOS12067.1 hypothetical protein XI38_01260 [Microbacterium chocolatum]